MIARAVPGALHPTAGLPGLSLWQRRFMALLGWILAATLLTLLVWSANPWFIGQGSHAAVRFNEQRFHLLPNAAQAGSEWVDVTLPDTWAARGQRPSGAGR